MIDSYMTVVPNGLACEDDSLEKLRIGETVRVRITSVKGRNGRFHRKFWALIGTLHPYIEERIPDRDLFRHWITMKAGFFDLGPEGEQWPTSISYDSMQQEKFERLYSAVVDFAVSTFLPATMDRDSVDAEVERILRGFG